MALVLLSQIPSGPLLSIDPGSKRLGLAACNGARTLVSPVKTILRTKFMSDAKHIFELYDERRCSGIILGLPVHMNDKEGRRAQSSRSFATNLLRVRDIPIAYQDERLSSFAANEALITAQFKPAKRKAFIDAHAAVIILQSALDSMDRITNHGSRP